MLSANIQLSKNILCCMYILEFLCIYVCVLND